eukprot:835420-Pleurochrysis_carterae.AAC.5
MRQANPIQIFPCEIHPSESLSTAAAIRRRPPSFPVYLRARTGDRGERGAHGRVHTCAVALRAVPAGAAEPPLHAKTLRALRCAT